MALLKAFLIGGMICAIVQIFIDKTKLMPGRIMVGLVVIGTILGFFGIYQIAVTVSIGVDRYRDGWGVKEAVDSDGLLGIFMGGLKASAVGISGALIFGFIGSLFFKSKMQG